MCPSIVLFARLCQSRMYVPGMKVTLNTASSLIVLSGGATLKSNKIVLSFTARTPRPTTQKVFLGLFCPVASSGINYVDATRYRKFRSGGFILNLTAHLPPFHRIGQLKFSNGPTPNAENFFLTRPGRTLSSLSHGEIQILRARYDKIRKKCHPQQHWIGVVWSETMGRSCCQSRTIASIGMSRCQTKCRQVGHGRQGATIRTSKC